MAYFSGFNITEQRRKHQPKPLGNGRFRSGSRIGKIFAADILSVFRGFKSERDAEMERKRVFLKGLNGFTLIELMIVIAIIGILAAIAFTYLESTRQSAWNISARHDLKKFVTAMETYFSQHNRFEGNPGQSIRNDGTPSDFSVDTLKLSAGVIITVVGGDPADPLNESDPYIVEAKHTNSKTIYEYNFLNNETVER